nr:GntR family transcriptional regulator [uncultured Roseococcus sp.]
MEDIKGRLARDQTLAERVYLRVRRALVGGRIAPGYRLVNRNLAAHLGVSLTPIREALLRLVNEGALELDARGIAVVPRLHPQRYAEITELRVELEGRAAMRAVALASDDDRAELREIQAALLAARQEPNFGRVLSENEKFHFRMLQIARMPVLQKLVETLWVQAGPTVNLLFTVDRDLSPGNHAHNDWLDAMERDDAQGARAALEDDLRRNAVIVMPLLEKELVDPKKLRSYDIDI